MEDKRVTAEQILAEIDIDVEHMAQKVADAINNLREYISKRIAMTDYPYFLDLGYDIGSGPTESFCGRLRKRLKGPGMRWDTDNAEAVMALASIYYSNQWDRRWKSRHKAA